MKRGIAAALCAVLAATAAACSEGGEFSESSSVRDDNDPISSSVTSETMISHDLPEGLDFDGAKIVIHTRGDYNSVDEIAVEDTSNQVYEAIYRRNSFVEEELHVLIEVFRSASWDAYYTVANPQLRASVSSGDAAFDLISGWQPCIPELAAEGLMTDLMTLPYIGTEKPWWTPSLVEELTIDGKLHFVSGDISVLTMLGSMRVFVCNKKLADDNRLPDLYEVVRQGEWTIDYVTQLTRSAYRDDGDAVVNEKDTYGLQLGCANDLDAFLASARIKMTERDEKGRPYLSMPEEQMTELIDRLYTMMYDNRGARITPADSGDESFAMMQDNRLLLAPFPMDTLRIALSDLKSDFMVLPYPKLNESQTRYGTRIQDALQIWGIPIDITGEELEAASAVLEALGCESWQSVTPVYFDTALKGRYTRDEESKEMMDLIKDSVYLTFEMIYNNYVGTPGYTLRNMLGSKNRDFMSYWSKREGPMTDAFNTVLDKLCDS